MVSFNTLEQLSKNVERFESTLKSILRIALMSHSKAKTPAFGNTQKECVILGNGPSLNHSIEQHGEFLQDKDLFCVNSFPLTDRYVALKPRHLVLNATIFWEPNVGDGYIRHRNNIYEAIVQRTSWPLNIFIPHRGKTALNWRQLFANNENISITFYNSTPIDGWTWFKNLAYQNQLGLPRPHNVLIPAIWLALNSRYRTLYLFGADHNWLPDIKVSSTNQALIRHRHFYTAREPSYGPMYLDGTRSRHLHEILLKFYYSFVGYHDLAKYAQTLDIPVYNLTTDSYIDAFERLEL